MCFVALRPVGAVAGLSPPNNADPRPVDNSVSSVGVSVSGRGVRTALLADLRARIAKIEQHPLRLPPSPPENGCLPSAHCPSPFSTPAVAPSRQDWSADHSRARRSSAGWYLGIEEIDRLLPAGGLTHVGLHEIKPERPGDLIAALGFALGLGALRLRQTRGARSGVVWVQPSHDAGEYGRAYAPGLISFGLDPASLIIVEPKTLPDALWAIEESLKGDEDRSGHPLAFVLACVTASTTPANSGRRGARPRTLDATAQRRLTLAAARGDTPCLLLTSHASPGLTGAHTRWRIGRYPNQTVTGPPSVSSPPSLSVAARAPPLSSAFAAQGHCRLQVRLERCRGASTILDNEGRSFDLEWCDEAYRFRLVTSLAGGACEIPSVRDARSPSAAFVEASGAPGSVKTADAVQSAQALRSIQAVRRAVRAG